MTELTRRGFITGLAALVALAAIKDGSAYLPQSDRERLMAQVRDFGVIRNQTFRIEGSEPLVFDGVLGLVLDSCEFRFVDPLDSYAVIFRHTAITALHCAFLCDHPLRKGGAVLKFESGTSSIFNGLYAEHGDIGMRARGMHVTDIGRGNTINLGPGSEVLSARMHEGALG